MIALAPAMAKAILEHDPHGGGIDIDFLVVRQRLEQIGGVRDV